MLCKVSGNYIIGKLQVIQFLKEEVQMYYRLVRGKRLVKSAINNNLFSKERPGYAIILQSMLPKISSPTSNSWIHSTTSFIS